MLTWEGTHLEWSHLKYVSVSDHNKPVHQTTYTVHHFVCRSMSGFECNFLWFPQLTCSELLTCPAWHIHNTPLVQCIALFGQLWSTVVEWNGFPPLTSEALFHCRPVTSSGPMMEAILMRVSPPQHLISPREEHKFISPMCPDQRRWWERGHQCF